jgi:hypothetical protein
MGRGRTARMDRRFRHWHGTHSLRQNLSHSRCSPLSYGCDIAFAPHMAQKPLHPRWRCGCCPLPDSDCTGITCQVKGVACATRSPTPTGRGPACHVILWDIRTLRRCCPLLPVARAEPRAVSDRHCPLPMPQFGGTLVALLARGRASGSDKGCWAAPTMTTNLPLADIIRTEMQQKPPAFPPDAAPVEGVLILSTLLTALSK